MPRLNVIGGRSLGDRRQQGKVQASQISKVRGYMQGVLRWFTPIYGPCTDENILSCCLTVSQDFKDDCFPSICWNRQRNRWNRWNCVSCGTGFATVMMWFAPLLVLATSLAQPSLQQDGNNTAPFPNATYPNATSPNPAASVNAQFSPPYYPAPWATGAGSGAWADAYAQAQAFVSQLTITEKVNLTTGVG